MEVSEKRKRVRTSEGMECEVDAREKMEVPKKKGDGESTRM